MNAIQYELFEENDEISLLKRDNAALRDELRRSIRALFAMTHSISKEMMVLKGESFPEKPKKAKKK